MAALGSIEVLREKESGPVFVLRIPGQQGVGARVELHSRHGCDCGCGGGWDHGRARAELRNIGELIRVGLWSPPTPPTRRRRRRDRSNPTFAVYAQKWLKAKISGELGPKAGIATRTAELYESQLRIHLVPFFGPRLLRDIDREICQSFKAEKMREARELATAIAAGADLRDHRGQRMKPLAPTSIKKLIDLLAMVLGNAVEDGLIPANPARGRRMRIEVPRPRRPFLELDELADLLDAAAELDQTVQVPYASDPDGTTRSVVREKLSMGMRPSVIAAELELSKSTVSWHMSRMPASAPPVYRAHLVVCELLARTGLRVGEMRALRIADVLLDATTGAHLRVTDSKTEAGVRDVQLSPRLVAVLSEHLYRLRASGLPHTGSAFLLPNSKGGKITARRVRVVLAAAIARANELRARRARPALPLLTPHGLRRTYVSIALLANQFDVKWVMGQVGHSDSRMTMEVYAQLSHRIRREHGMNLDRLILRARRQSLASRPEPLGRTST